jgi:hypothetical protein
MTKSRNKRDRQRRQKIKEQAMPPQPPQPPATPLREKTSILSRVPKLLYGLFGFGAALLAYFVFWPSLSIQQDFSYSPSNPFNTSVSIFNEGLLTLTDLSATCNGNVRLVSDNHRPALPLQTSTEYTNFSKKLRFRHRASLPCDHNVMANGHRLDPNSALEVVIRYKVFGKAFPFPQTFHFQAVAGADGAYHWQYND